jgi:hypothetical protein
MKKSAFLNLNWQDFFKGLVVAVLGAVVAIIAPSIQDGSLVFDWTTIWHTGVAAGIAYLSKNLLSQTPKVIQIDPSKTSVVDSDTKRTIVSANNSLN